MDFKINWEEVCQHTIRRPTALLAKLLLLRPVYDIDDGVPPRQDSNIYREIRSKLEEKLKKP